MGYKEIKSERKEVCSNLQIMKIGYLPIPLAKYTHFEVTKCFYQNKVDKKSYTKKYKKILLVLNYIK